MRYNWIRLQNPDALSISSRAIYERDIGVGIFVSQLPPSELARLKAELAETLISNFCYPRFYDYRIDSLRMRPVDRTKRQEVWQYLGSIDFNAWGRIDLMSLDFQRQVERLLIYFVQKNRTFFGEQGRKRVADIRMLISTSSTSIVEGLRGHLTGRSNGFGNPRPVNSWANTNITQRPDTTWEQLVTPTMLLQYQIQEARGEIKATHNVVRTNEAPPRHSIHDHSIANGTSNSSVEHEIAPNQVLIIEEVPDSSEVKQESAFTKERIIPQKQTSEPEPGFITASAILQSQELTQAQPTQKVEVTAKEHATTTALISEEDVVIFEQMKHQLVVWTRVEAVRAGLDISGREASELLERLQQLDGFDETRLQVTSTLINLCDQIIAAGQASLLEYKQAIMFYLMHTRSFR